MDEWHQFMSVTAVRKFGTPNIHGSAHGVMLFFIIGVLYLAPFVLTGMLPLGTLGTNILDREKLFIILRLQTLFFGIGSLLLFAKIISKYIDRYKIFTFLFFLLTPIWIMLSNYYKYDIALLFGIILSLYCIFSSYEKRNTRIFILAGIACGFTTAMKISGLPILALYIFSFFFPAYKYRMPFRYLLYGLIGCITPFLFLGIPDVLLHLGQYDDFFSSNLLLVPSASEQYHLLGGYWMYLVYKQIPWLFGLPYGLLFIVAFFYWGFVLTNALRLRKITMYRMQLLLFIGLLLFLVSLLPLKLYAAGNRSLVLLPFFALLTGYMLNAVSKTVFKTKKGILTGILVLLTLLQLVQTFAWVKVKLSPDPRYSASQWLQSYIPKGTTIGVENIPIYQFLPDIIERDMYFADGINMQKMYRYRILDRTKRPLPPVIVLTGVDILPYTKGDSSKKMLLHTMEKLHYKKVKTFSAAYGILTPFVDPLGYEVLNLVPVAPITIYIWDIQKTQ
jgi:4-amino-4-deoxy-L-arabinose transferase-like glycosyltransferase